MTIDVSKLDVTKLSTPNDRRLEEAFKGDHDLARFCMEWMACGGNATKAYKKLHPTVTYGSARVMGARMLAKVNIHDLLSFSGLNNGLYARLLLEGLNATKIVKIQYEYDGIKGRFEPVTVPDNATRFKYFGVLGRVLGIDQGPPGPTAVFNNLNAQVTGEEQERR